MKTVFLKYLLLFFPIVSFAQQALPIPDTISGGVYNLSFHRDSVQFLPGHKTQTYGFNNRPYLGPTLILRAGTNASMLVQNQLADTTTVHWHGLHVPAAKDGGPHTVILPGATWNPQFTVLDKAATYWYHPHMHMKTAEQVMKGGAGMIIVRDNAERALSLPRKYGIDDFPLIVQSQQFAAQNQIDHRGMQDSLLLINGIRANYGTSAYLNVPAQVVRLRLLNASQERSFRFGFTGNRSFAVIGNDGGLLPVPVTTTRIQLAPGERAEILVNLTGQNGQNLYLMSYASEIPVGVTGGPTMPMPAGSPPMNSPLNGVNFNLLQLNVGLPTANPITAVPVTLIPANQNPYSVTQANATRTINITADSGMVMDGPFYFNNQLFDMMRIDYTIPLNNVEIWQVSNQTMVGHPFHIHDVQFYILDRDGIAPEPAERGRKDVVMINPNETVRFITRFEDFSDPNIPYMYHCHILMHEDDGMMGQFVVSSSPAGNPENLSAEGVMQLFPNPANTQVQIRVNSEHAGGEIEVRNVLGQVVLSQPITKNDLNVNTSDWPKGLYTVTLKQNGQRIHKKLVVQ
jgi:blue copper oxidase